MDKRVRTLAKVCRQVLGIPDYGTYVEHMRTRHPGEPVLSEREFHVRAIERKYKRPGTRCC